MDDTDRKLLMLIAAEPRIHSRELAQRLGISKQTVQQRMQILTMKGVLRGITAGISIFYLDAVYVLVFGKSNTTSIEDTLDRLGESELTHGVIVAGGNFLYVRGLLRNISELNNYGEFVRRAAEMPTPTVGIFDFDVGIMPDYVDGARRKKSYKELTALDLRIIASLKNSVRRPVADIADAIGVSVKTVRRRLNDMISEGSLDFFAPLDLVPDEDMFTLMHVNLREGANKEEVGRRLFAKYPHQTLYIRSFSNLPNFLLCTFCSDKMAEIHKVLRMIGEDEDVLAAVPDHLYHERIYSTWLDKLPAALGCPSRKTGTRSTRFEPKMR
ncbi:MAG TPA: winged helix-turn-helix transcriptional regulator [Thermoplasmata archaeon]|jgi:DNA-binding Lrp family transcriptional regulator